MDEKRMKEVFSDEAFVKELLSLKSPEEVQEVLKKKGIEASIEEVLGLQDALLKAQEKARGNGGELSMDDLDEVAGGAPYTAIPRIF